MIDLPAQAYAVSVLNNSDSETFTRQEMYYAIAEAYEQGYIDCGTEGERPETQDEFFNDGITSMPLCLFAAKYGLDVEEVYAKVKDKVIDKDGRIAETVPHIKIGLNLNTGEMEFNIDDIGCKWYDLGCCSKGMPGITCEREGCMAYYPKETRNNEKKRVDMTQEQFEKMYSLNETIKHLEGVLAKVDYANMEMCFFHGEPFQNYKDEVNASYYGLIPKEEREKLTAEMRERLKAALTQRINELKAEFEKIWK